MLPSPIPRMPQPLRSLSARGPKISGRGSCRWDIDGEDLYSYDWLDRLFGFLDRPSTDLILPQFQHLSVGDKIPLGRGPSFPVAAIEPCRALVLAGSSNGFQWVWQFGLYPLDGGRTRLISRNSAYVRQPFSSWFLMRMLEPAAFIMTRKMLIGLKRRAERLAMSH